MIRMIVAPLAGAAVGYLYYRFIGCSTGTCPITSNPWASTLYGALMGFMLGSVGSGK